MSDWESTLSDEERAMGFSALTLTYPQAGRDVPLLPGGGTFKERVVAVLLGDSQRVRRRHTGSGYVHEQFDGERWRLVSEFADLAEVAASAVWRTYSSQQADTSASLTEEE